MTEGDHAAAGLLRKTHYVGDVTKNEIFEEYFYNSEEDT